MEVENKGCVGGSLQISTDVIAKIAKLAALEVDGVSDVAAGPYSAQKLLGRNALQKPVRIKLLDDIAEITVELIVDYGSKVPAVCEKVQENVKSTVQNMTGITVSRVNLVVMGIRGKEEAQTEE